MDLRILSDDELLALAREINLELLRRVPANVPPAAAETPAPILRCPHCNGTGLNNLTDEYCACAMGRDLNRVQNRGLSKFAPAEAKYAGPEPEWAEDDESEEGS